MTRLPATAVLALAIASGCSGGTPPELPPPPETTIEVAAGSAGGYDVRLLAAAPLRVGLNSLALEVQAAGSAARVTDAALEFVPLLTTSVTDPGLAGVPHVVGPTGAFHRCPVSGPGAAGPDGRYPLQAVFQVPSGPGAWTADVEIARGGPPVTVSLSTLSVSDAPGGAQWRLAASFLDGATGYVMALQFLAPPRVGVIPIGVTLHEAQDSGMAFAPVSDAVLDVVPDMPSMSHGSTGGTDPTLVTSGWYVGSANFTMPGWWVVEIPAGRAGVPIGTPAFSVSF